MTEYAAPELEKTVIGAIINGGSLALDIIHHPLVFTDRNCQVVYVGVMDLVRQGREVEMSTIVDWLTTAPCDTVYTTLRNCREAQAKDGLQVSLSVHSRLAYSEAAGEGKAIEAMIEGFPWLSDVMKHGSTAGLEANCERLVSLYQSRCLIDGVNGILSGSRGEEQDVTSLIGRLDDLCVSVSKKTAKTDVYSAKDLVFNWLEDASVGQPHSTGFTGLDAALGGGLHDGSNHFIAARPGAGKTTAAIQIATKLKQDGGCPVYCSYEMPPRDLAIRHLCLVGKTKRELLDRVKARQCAPAEQQAVLEMLEIQDELSPTFPNVAAWDLTTLCSNIKRMHAKGECTALFIDYLQLVRNKYITNPVDRITCTSETLTNLGLQLDIPIVSLAQMSRDAEKDDRAPRMSDLKGSSQMEQDAAFILILDRAHKEQAGDIKDMYGYVPKTRFSEPCVLKAKANFSTFRFLHNWERAIHVD